MRRAIAITGGALAALVAALAGHGCEDGSHILREELERAPVIPKAPTARTSPVADFDRPGTAFPVPAGGFGAGPAGLAIVRSDLGESSSALSIEESDALACDPAAHRVLLLKSRARGATPSALVFASSGAGGALDGASGAYVAEPTVAARRVLVSTSAGYAVMPEAGAPVASHPVAGGPFSAITVFESEHVIFLVAGATIRRQAYDATTGEFGPASGAVGELVYTGSAPIGQIAVGLNGDLLVTEGDALRRIPAAGTVAAPAPVVLTAMTFATGSIARGVCLDSASNAVVAVDRTGAGGGAPGALFEVGLTALNQAEGAAVSSVTLTAAPRAVAIDGRHGAFTVSFATEVRPFIETAPDLEERIQPVFNARGCIGCHPVVNPVIDLTSADSSFSTLVNQAVSPSCLAIGAGNVPPPAPVYVSPGDVSSSLIVQKVQGIRDGSSNAACGARMPQALRPIPEVEIDALSAWIESGADR